ncbi:MAG: Ni-sirohydrochlorin a,c-diamide reductive cyclase catalytic subunit [Methanophagales archaeon]|nr:Ni-sirohydrochlorin a,c-diamide reductive cyclase catalytic subunit [Methanophagales archaeon]MCW3139194.1 Ni-sirohydrochlorin a,c-diamide reductive cyclase catalytic subunit [Methanophagales archaeon]MCW7069721.1 Ni-sirohydrochlorin a,c-diamide reductive cyclase catalytic subunit [Methanophagales archaeon]
MSEEMILHPRPSAIVAALYTLRDLDVDVAVMHGPAGCSFKHSRLLEEDGMHVLTTAMNESNFVFGGHDSLVNVLRKAEEMFQPRLMGVVGTCSSMIIGEDLNRAIEDSGVSCSVIAVNVHAGYRDNTTGVILTLESAYKAGIISIAEFERQKRILDAATKIEKEVGAASRNYIPPSKGDSKIDVAKRLLELINMGKKGVCVLNAKKETAFMFADILRALNRVAAPAQIVNIANLDSTIGLSKIRGYSVRIIEELAAEGIRIDHIIGGLDEYPIAGERAAALIRSNYSNCDFVVLLGVPHAVPLRSYGINTEVFSVTNGPRTVQPLKWLGHDHVVLEIDLHPKTMGATGIIPSEFGDMLQKLSS